MKITYPVSEFLTILQLKEKTKYNNVLELNRCEYKDHVDQLYTAMKEQLATDTFVFLSPITIAVMTKHTWVLDGQHRLSTFEKLSADGHMPPDTKIPVYWITVSTRQEAENLFKRINTVQPYFELPEKCDVVKILMKELQRIYPDTIRSDTNQNRCQVPRIMASKLERDLVCLTDVPDISNVTVSCLITLVKKANLIIKNKCSSAAVKSLGEKLNDFYLGCDKEWYKLVRDELLADTTQPTRTKISADLRKSVWGKIYSGIDGNCEGCGQSIDVYNYIVAHIIPVSKKGKNTLDNLYPLCKDCNSKMGAKSFQQYFGKEHFDAMIAKTTY